MSNKKDKPQTIQRHATCFKRQRVQLECEPFQGEVQQQFKAEVNINNIIKKFQNGGEITHVNPLPQNYGEATGQSFTEAMYMVKDAEENFMNLPSEIRKEFKNDVSLYLDALSDPSQASVLADLGLIEPLPTETELKAPESTQIQNTSPPEGQAPHVPETGETTT